MKLEEKFIDAIYNEVSASKIKRDCAKIADDFAIGFFNWATTYKANDKNNWQLNTKELLEIYKKEKGL
jgi:hypothetical protein